MLWDEIRGGEFTLKKKKKQNHKIPRIKLDNKGVRLITRFMRGCKMRLG